MVFTLEFLRGNALLQKLMRTEPETLLRSLTVDAGPIIDWAGESSATLLTSELLPGITPAEPNNTNCAPPASFRPGSYCHSCSDVSVTS